MSSSYGAWARVAVSRPLWVGPALCHRYQAMGRGVNPLNIMLLELTRITNAGLGCDQLLRRAGTFCKTTDSAGVSMP